MHDNNNANDQKRLEILLKQKMEKITDITGITYKHYTKNRPPFVFKKKKKKIK